MEPEAVEQVEISVVVPFFNEEENVPLLAAELRAVLEEMGRSYELVLVDDGSTDGTWERIRALHAESPRVVGVRLLGNQGQTAALAAGFDRARGRIVISMDGDLQHDPREIPKFVAGIDEGYDLASGWRAQRRDDYWRRQVPSKLANRAMAVLSGIPLRDFGTTFKAYRREILENVRLYGQFHRFIPVLAQRMKPRIIEIPIEDRPRLHGRSKYNLRRTFTVFFDLIRLKFLTTYLTRPLQVFGSLGVLLGGSGSLILLWLILKKYLQGISIMEYRAPLFIFSILLTMAGLQLFTMGLLGEMLVKLHHEQPGTRCYVVAEVLPGGAGAPDR
jgi:glycosyltransferase involved in cell wall biosynthesis